jgi:hypothetical protein
MASTLETVTTSETVDLLPESSGTWPFYPARSSDLTDGGIARLVTFVAFCKVVLKQLPQSMRFWPSVLPAVGLVSCHRDPVTHLPDARATLAMSYPPGLAHIAYPLTAMAMGHCAIVHACQSTIRDRVCPFVTLQDSIWPVLTCPVPSVSTTSRTQWTSPFRPRASP